MDELLEQIYNLNNNQLDTHQSQEHLRAISQLGNGYRIGYLPNLGLGATNSSRQRIMSLEEWFQTEFEPNIHTNQLEKEVSDDEKHSEPKQFILTTNPLHIGQECPICYVQIDSEQLMSITPCNHTYHKKCLGDWLRLIPNCPSCREPVIFH